MFESHPRESSNMGKEKEADQTSSRKQDHIDICCNYTKDIEMDTSTGFEDIQFVHNALPDINFEAIDLSSTFLKHKFKLPIFISSMTGGTMSSKINERLAKLAAKFGIGIGVGSQRAALEDSKYIDSFSIIRKHAPSAFVASNLGAIQLNNNFSIKHAQDAIQMIDGNALILHLNPLQEVIQPEGNSNFSNLTEKISSIGKKLKQPLIVKEVGSGISYEVAHDLAANNVAAIDVAGAGGTSWSQIEAIRANRQGLTKQHNVGKLFKNWGIPTAVSLIEISRLDNKVETIASGGIRDGLQAAKALALGAKLVGIGLPLACLAHSSTEKQLIDWLEQFIHELKITMFLF